MSVQLPPTPQGSGTSAAEGAVREDCKGRGCGECGETVTWLSHGCHTYKLTAAVGLHRTSSTRGSSSTFPQGWWWPREAPPLPEELLAVNGCWVTGSHFLWQCSCWYVAYGPGKNPIPMLRQAAPIKLNESPKQQKKKKTTTNKNNNKEVCSVCSKDAMYFSY